MYYVNKKHLVTIEQMDKSFTLQTFGGEQIGLPGDYIGRHENKDREVIPKEVFDEEYVAVNVIKKVNEKQLSPFEEQNYLRLFGEVGGLNQEEDKKYIENTEKLVRNKAF